MVALRGLIRLAKTWRSWNNVPLSSFYLEMRTAQYVLGNKPIIYDWDLRDIFKSLANNGLWGDERPDQLRAADHYRYEQPRRVAHRRSLGQVPGRGRTSTSSTAPSTLMRRSLSTTEPSRLVWLGYC